MILEPEVRELIDGCIFKYGDSKNVERTLQNKTFGFSSLASFNDVHEPEYKLTHYFHSVEDEEQLLTPKTNTLHRIQELISMYLASLRVTCFSRQFANNLMWSHYADRHHGVCYCFDFKKNQPPFVDPINWGSVRYSSSIPDIKIFQGQTTEGMLPPMLSDIVLTKSQDWAYEQELRFWKQSESNQIVYDVSKLRAVILGRRAGEQIASRTQSLVDTFNATHGTTVRLLFAHRVMNTYGLGVHSSLGFQKSSETNSSISYLFGTQYAPLL